MSCKSYKLVPHHAPHSGHEHRGPVAPQIPDLFIFFAVLLLLCKQLVSSTALPASSEQYEPPSVRCHALPWLIGRFMHSTRAA